MKNLKDRRIQYAILGNLDQALEGLEQEDVDQIYLLLKIAEDHGSIEAGDRVTLLIENDQLAVEDTISLHRELCHRYLFGEQLPQCFEKAEAYFSDLDQDNVATIRAKLSGSSMKKFNEYFHIDSRKDSISSPLATGFEALIVTRNQVIKMNPYGEDHLRNDVTIAYPGFAIVLHYRDVLYKNAHKVAQIIEKYMDFIPKNTMNVALNRHGSYKAFTAGDYKKNQKDLQEASGKKHLHINIYYGQVKNPPHDYAGPFFVEFNTSINDDTTDAFEIQWNAERTNKLMLGFPVEYILEVGYSRLIEFYKSVITLSEVSSSYAGFFLHLGCELSGVSYASDIRLDNPSVHDALNTKFNYIITEGKDYSYKPQVEIYEIGWLNYYGKTMIDSLGGMEKIQQELPGEIEVAPFSDGLFIKTAQEPGYGRKGDRKDGYQALGRFVLPLVPGAMMAYWKEKFHVNDMK